MFLQFINVWTLFVKSMLWALSGLLVDLSVPSIWIVFTPCLTRTRAKSGCAPAEKNVEFGTNETHVRLLPRVRLAAWLRNAVPGTRVAVRYFDDDADHERILVWLVSLVHR